VVGGLIVSNEGEAYGAALLEFGDDGFAEEGGGYLLAQLDFLLRRCLGHFSFAVV
jgi:hypothetical protein